VLQVSLPAVATLTSRLTPTSSLRFTTQTPAQLSAALRAPAVLTLAMRQWNGVVPAHGHAIGDIAGLRSELDAIEANLATGPVVSGPDIYAFAADQG
jgi:hypothetical protein